MEWVLAHGRLAVIAALFFVGIALRRSGWVKPVVGQRLLDVVFNVGLPLLVFGALGGVQLDREYALLPLTALGTVLVCWAAAAFVSRRFFGLDSRGEGAMSLATMTVNVSMIYAFAVLSFTHEQFTQLVMFDMGHALTVWTLSSVVACSYGNHRGDIPVLLRKVLGAPALWVLALALGLNLSGAPVRQEWLDLSLGLGQGFVLLVPLAMGLIVTAHAIRRPEVITAVGMRSVLGALVGFGIATLFGLSDGARAVATVAAAAPVGFSAVVLAGREELDLELAASAAAISVFLGSIWIPIVVALV